MTARVKMERVGVTDMKIPLADSTEKTPSGVIECSLNMNVSLSDAKKSKIFQRTQSVLIVILAIVFAILCFHLKREVRALELQMNSVNSNLMMLMMRYDKLNKHFNRGGYHQVSKLDAETMKYRHSSSRKESENSSDGLRVKSAMTIADGLLRHNSTVVEGEKDLDKSSSLDFMGNMLEEARSIDERVEQGDAESADSERYERAIAAFERRNHETTTVLPSLRDDLTDNTITWNEPRAGRSRRDEGRGKKRRKIKRRLKRSRRRLGPLVATFIGAIPELHITDSGHIGPWFNRKGNESQYAFTKFHLVENMKSIEVTVNGLYMISVQIFYYGQESHCSYWILLSSEGFSHTKKVVKCATVSAVSATEATCYTSVVMPLQRGDRLHIHQQERNRLINLREGHSFVQIMLLSEDSRGELSMKK